MKTWRIALMSAHRSDLPPPHFNSVSSLFSSKANYSHELGTNFSVPLKNNWSTCVHTYVVCGMVFVFLNTLRMAWICFYCSVSYPIAGLIKTFSWGVISYQTKATLLASCQVLPFPIAAAFLLFSFTPTKQNGFHSLILFLPSELDAASRSWKYLLFPLNSYRILSLSCGTSHSSLWDHFIFHY